MNKRGNFSAQVMNYFQFNRSIFFNSERTQNGTFPHCKLSQLTPINSPDISLFAKLQTEYYQQKLNENQEKILCTGRRQT